jgi:hypothetical protein
VGFDELLDDSVIGAERAKRVAVGPRVVGHQPLNSGDAVRGEVSDRALEERRAAGALLVGQDFAIGEPGVVRRPASARSRNRAR